jgi:glycosyltransferase involved in cell wall biosynthesis
VRYISFSRNFGKEAALYAGLKYAKGKYVAVMDVDLQDPPSILPEMYKTLDEGIYDCVATRRIDRKGEPAIRSAFSRLFYKILKQGAKDVEIKDGARDFRMMTRRMVDAVLLMSEYNRFSKGLFGWVGFKTKWLEYENINRSAGESKWKFSSLTRYALDGIINYSNVPLNISSYFGILMTILSFLMLVIIIVRKILFGDPVDGWASTVCIIIFIGGIQLLCLGIMGQYIAKTYMEVKSRPIYIIAESNLEKEQYPNGETSI